MYICIYVCIISGNDSYSEGLENSYCLVGIVLDRPVTPGTVIILLLLLDQ